jgi:hypothetical protein
MTSSADLFSLKEIMMASDFRRSLSVNQYSTTNRIAKDNNV